VFKRSIDIVLAGLLLAVALPLLALAALLIKLDSDGPAIFCQTRMGRGFKRFQLIKLRTMVVGEGGPAYTLGADPRITRTGRWLRKLKLDELPQLWNVLQGDMSLVGPRPVIPELTEEFAGAYEQLLAVRPGLTDPATLKYCCEVEMLAMVPDPLRYFKSVVTPDKLRISQAYLRRATVWTDLGVLASTALALCASVCQRPLRAAVSARLVGAGLMPSYAEGVRRRRNQPAFEHTGVVGPIAMWTFAEESSGLYGLAASNDLAYRHFRQAPAFAEGHREHFPQ
jgi:lipopolysaccharide/colanic/teichoic acid biosynthesis glycosyltransferase